MFFPIAPTRSELMRCLIDEIAMADASADDAHAYDCRADPGDGWAMSMKRVEKRITNVVEVMRVLRAAGYTW